MVVQVAAMDVGSGRTNCGGRGVGASQADHVVPVRDEVTNHGRADET